MNSHVHEFGFGIQNAARNCQQFCFTKSVFLRQQINFQTDVTYTNAVCKKYSDVSKKQTFLLFKNLFVLFTYKKNISDTFKENFKTNRRVVYL